MIDIQLTPLSYRVRVAPNGQLLGTTLYLSNYLRRFNQTSWDHRLNRPTLLRRFLYYNDKTQTLYLPRYDFEAFCQFLRDNRITYSTAHLPLQSGRAVEIRLKSWVQDRNERQTGAITYLTTDADPLRGLSLGTGIGKTYCTIKSISILGRRAMVCVGGLVEQWKRAILDFTELTEADIYVIQGAPSMTKLLTQIDRNIHPKIILCSLGTIRNYAVDHASYANYPSFDEICDRLSVGVRVVDEAHLNFWLTMIIDLRTNAMITVPLSATFDRGDQQVKRIFDNHYPRLMRFGENQYNRYIDIYSYSYTLGGTIAPKSYSTPQGYNHSKFEDWLLRKDTKLEYIYAIAYSPAVFAHYVNVRRVGQKLLILCATVDMCKWFKKRLELDLPSQENFTVALYNYGSSDDILRDVDIIISTPGSAGTGTDIKNLRTVLMTIATGSDNTNKQTLGRLRELDNGDTPIYAYTWCRDIIPHGNYQETRRNTYQMRGKSFSELQV